MKNRRAVGLLNPMRDKNGRQQSGGRRDDTCDHGLSRSWEVKVCEKKKKNVLVCSSVVLCLIGKRPSSCLQLFNVYRHCFFSRCKCVVCRSNAVGAVRCGATKIWRHVTLFSLLAFQPWLFYYCEERGVYLCNLLVLLMLLLCSWPPRAPMHVMCICVRAHGSV